MGYVGFCGALCEWSRPMCSVYPNVVQSTVKHETDLRVPAVFARSTMESRFFPRLALPVLNEFVAERCKFAKSYEHILDAVRHIIVLRVPENAWAVKVCSALLP
mmetsp:Transcript_26393/g.87515  ORF Transcript_26393/g.87515 Transcript_26393/m.87515 type:complete len:104 (-) Transcript_26393:13-324(-)